MEQRRGKSDPSGRFTMNGSYSGSREWPHLKNDSLLQQSRSHGTAATLAKIRPEKPAIAHVQISPPPLWKKPSEPRFPHAVERPGLILMDFDFGEKSAGAPLVMETRIRV